MSVLHVAAWTTLAACAWIAMQALVGIVQGVYKGVRDAIGFRLAVRKMRKMSLAELEAYARRNADPPSGG